METGFRARRAPRIALPALLGAAALVLLAGAAPAQGANWQCRAGALSASLLGNTPIDPLVANSGFGPCVDGAAGPQNVTASLGLPADVISAVTASANTDITPGAPASQRFDAVARIEHLSIALPPGGGLLTLGVRVATARVVGGCAAAAPALAGTSEVAGLSLNGRELPLEQLLAQANTALAPLGQVLDLRLGEQVRTGSALTRRAVRARVLSATGGAVLDVVAGEARGGADGGVCRATGDGDGDPAAGSAGGTPTGAQVCPSGTTLDARSGRCVIRVVEGGVLGEIVVGRPFEGPSGGTVMSLADARARHRSACLRGGGPDYVIVGTARGDRVTGTNGRDRILLLGGADRGDGGRGDDCVDGGAGRDVISGAQDADRVFGAAGHDSLNGGPGRDRLSGGAGNDTINAAYGADVVLGGAGRDAVNVATAGPRATVHCGAGRDTARLNAGERRRVRGCERRLMLPDLASRRG